MPLRSLSSLATTSKNYCYILFANTCQSRPNLMMDYLSATSRRLNLIIDDRRKPCWLRWECRKVFIFISYSVWYYSHKPGNLVSRQFRVGLREDEYRILSTAHTSRGSEFIAVMRLWSGTGRWSPRRQDPYDYITWERIWTKPTHILLSLLSLFSPLLLFPLDPELSPACCRRQNKEEYVPQDRQYHHELVIALVSPLASAAAYTARECIECLLYLRREYFDVIYRSILVLIQPPWSEVVIRFEFLYYRVWSNYNVACWK